MDNPDIFRREKTKFTRSTELIILFKSTLVVFVDGSLVSVRIWIEIVLRQSIITRETSSFYFLLLRIRF